MEGCITMGLGYTLTEEVRFKDGEVLDHNFDSYQLPRFSWLPTIQTIIIDNPDLPSQGCGEPAITTMGFGGRQRHLRRRRRACAATAMTPARVWRRLRKPELCLYY